jgi:serine protease inhibitor
MIPLMPPQLSPMPMQQPSIQQDSKTPQKINLNTTPDTVSIQFGAKKKNSKAGPVKDAEKPGKAEANSKLTQAQVNSDVDQANTIFTQNVMKAIAGKATTQSTIISPANTFLLLSMINAGATGASEKEIKSVMGLKTNATKEQVVKGVQNYVAEFAKVMKETGITLEQSFGIWKEPGTQWHNDFTKRMEILGAEKGDLTGAEAINAWAASKTNNKIKTIVSDQDVRNAQSVLASATYLNSNWRKQFNDKKTFDTDFNGLNQVTKVKMMQTEDKFAFDQSNPLYDAVRMPYGKKSDSGKELSMTLFLPKDGKSLAAAYDALFANGQVSPTLKKLQSQASGKLNLMLPKFTIDTETNTKDVLSNMGLTKIFGGASQLTEIIKNDSLFVSAMKQKAFIDVSEKGTEAAAVDVAVMRTLSVSMTPTMVFNKPFIGVIHDDQCRMLFINTVTDLPKS